DKMNKETRKKANESLKALRKQRVKVAEKYGSIKESTGESWEHLKKGFSDAYKTLQKTWEKSKKEFGSDK
ncbi:MAG: hypothetical protein R6V39_00875, partial [Desulfovibrionales bacterium]